MGKNKKNGKRFFWITKRDNNGMKETKETKETKERLQIRAA